VTQPAHLKAGRERAAKQRKREAIARVKAYERWLAKGAPLKDIPTVPSNNDYAVARAAGKVNR
jgi:hypothetical protein